VVVHRNFGNANHVIGFFSNKSSGSVVGEIGLERKQYAEREKP
jgi:hypothetical protein